MMCQAQLFKVHFKRIMKLSNLSYSLVGQKMFQILAQCKELESKGKNILHFEIGDPDFSTPSNIAIELK